MDWIITTRSFCQVAETKSFTEAAKIERVSPSAISKRIEWLEKNLGTTLFIRTTRHIHLTEAGESFLQRANCFIKQFDTMVSETRDGANHPSGLLRIAAPLSVGSTLLMPQIEAFLQQHEKMKVQLDVQAFGTNPDLDHDLVICRKKEDFNSASHRGVKLKTYQMGIFGAPDYLQAHQPIDTLEDVEQLNFIVAGFQARQGMVEMNNGRELSLANHNFISENLDAMLYAACQGMGLILATPEYIRKEIENGQLVNILPQYRSTERELWAFYPKSDHMPLKTRLFLDLLKREI